MTSRNPPRLVCRGGPRCNPLLHASPHRFGFGAGRGGWVCAPEFVVVDRCDDPLAFRTDELGKRTAFEFHDDGFVCLVHRVGAVRWLQWLRLRWHWWFC